MSKVKKLYLMILLRSSQLNKIRSYNFLKYSILSVLIFIFVAIIVIFYKSEQRSIEEIQIQNLEEVTTQQANALQLSIENAIRELKTLSFSISNDIDNPLVLKKVLDDIVTHSTFKFASISETNGNTLTSTGEHLSIKNDPSFAEVLKGETVIIDPTNFTFYENTMIKLATPVYNEGNLIAVLAVAFDQSELNKLFNLTYNGTSETYLLLNNGEIFLGTGKNENSNIENALSQWIKGRIASIDSLSTKDLKTVFQKSEYIRIKENNLNLLAFHRPVGFNDWNLLLTVPESTFKSSFGIFNNNHLDILSVIILSVVILISGAILYQFYIRNQKHINQIEEITFVDWLTKGNNLVKFRLLAKDYLKKKKRGTKDVICVIDIKDFRLINERYGHHEGDQILKLTYQAINKVIGYNGIICRGHIDRYFILTPYEDEKSFKSYGKNIKETLNSLLLEENISYQVDLISGVYVIGEFEVNLDDLLEKANFALRYSKENKEIFTILYDDEITQQEIAKMQLEEDLQRALDHNEFQVYLQPKFDLQKNCIIGAEALCRWKTPDGKLIPPIQFIPVLEKNKKIATLDLYMFESVCRLQRDWLNQGINIIPISINQSKVLIFRNDYVDAIQEIAQRYDVQPNLISIELTETMVFEEVDKLKSLVDSLREIGFSVSIDDFGTGYSSLNLLKDIHVDTVKIDKSFMGDIQELKQNILLTGVIQLIKRLGMVALVEGVEKEDQLAFLKEAGADVCQGFIFDAPIPVNHFFDKYLKEKQFSELVVY